MASDSLDHAHILIVDDNPINIKVLTLILQKHNYEVQAVTDGVDAIIAASEHPPDLIMLDIMMPGLDGFTVCEQLKADPETRSIPIIFLTALHQVTDKIKGFALGAADYVTKPFQAEEVLARIQNHIKMRRLQKELEEKQQALERKQADLERQNEELARKNEELEQSHAALVQAHLRVEAVFAALTEALPGTVLDDKYRLEEKIGEGGFGTVYRAHQIGLDRTVAIKVFRPSENQGMQATELERFRQEGMAACRIQHPNAVSVLDFAISQTGIAYLVMELLTGHTVADELIANRPLPIRRCVQILLPICSLLAEAHQQNLIHRDIKPDNIFLHQTPNGEVVKVVDFGIAKLLRGKDGGDTKGLTRTGSFVGTPSFISPERLRDAPYDGRSDVYSLGVVFYQMLTGQLPFVSKDHDMYAVITMHLTRPPQRPSLLNPNVPEVINDLVMRMLLKNPSIRPDAAEVGRALEAFWTALETLEKSDPGFENRLVFDISPTLPPPSLEEASQPPVKAVEEKTLAENHPHPAL